jgi:S-DNA-T family DNA segregation ATPase FtsK/SpoIIIE
MAEIERRRRSIPGTDRPALAIAARDLLSDLDHVHGTERARLADLPALLRDHGPTWTPYRSLAGVELASLGVRMTNTGNLPRLDPADLQCVLADRNQDDDQEVG